VPVQRLPGERAPASGAGAEGKARAAVQRYRIDDLARAAGTTSRNVRAYQDRGLLPRPDRLGRANVYGPEHLERLRLIDRLLDRGHTLAGIKELLDAWESGAGLGGVLGLAAEVAGPWSDEEPAEFTAAELAAAFGGTHHPELLAEAVRLGVLDPLGPGERPAHPTPPGPPGARDALAARGAGGAGVAGGAHEAHGSAHGAGEADGARGADSTGGAHSAHGARGVTGADRTRGAEDARGGQAAGQARGVRGNPADQAPPGSEPPAPGRGGTPPDPGAPPPASPPLAERYRAASPSLLRVAMELQALGVPPEEALGQLGALRSDLERIAHRFVSFSAQHVFADYAGRPLADADAEVIAGTVRRLRPLAEQAVCAELARALRTEAVALLDSVLTPEQRPPHSHPSAATDT